MSNDRRRNRIKVSLSLTDAELELLQNEMKKHAFNEKATFIKWVVQQYVKGVQSAALAAVLLIGVVSTAHAGVDFRFVSGKGEAIRKSTLEFVQSVQARNKKQAEIAYERVQDILRSLPDKDRQSKLMQEYLALMEKIRRMSLEANETLLASAEGQKSLDDLKSIVTRQGAMVNCRSEVIR